MVARTVAAKKKATSRSGRLTKAERKCLEGLPAIEYLFKMPKSVPDGKVLVHNQVRPRRILGRDGFRAWLSSPDPKRLVVCECDWAPKLGVHWRVAATMPYQRPGVFQFASELEEEVYDLLEENCDLAAIEEEVRKACPKGSEAKIVKKMVPLLQSEFMDAIGYEPEWDDDDFDEDEKHELAHALDGADFVNIAEGWLRLSK